MKKKYFILLLISAFNVYSQWVNQPVIPDPPALFSCYAYNSLTAWACGDSGVVLYTSNGGINWLYRGSSQFSTNRVFSIHAIGPQTALCVVNGPGRGQIFKTTNAGTGWVQKYIRDGVFLNDIEFMNNLTGFVYGNPINNFWFILKTTDGGETYDSTSINRPMPFSPGDVGFPNDHVVINNAGQPHIWFGSSNLWVFFSTNGGVTWNSSQTPGNPFILCLTFLNIQTGFAGGQNNAFITNNGALNWLPLPPLPGTGPFMSFANIAGFVWYSRGPCIFYSTNTGQLFTQQHCSPNGSTYNHMSFTLLEGDNSMSVITGWGVTGDGVISKYTDVTGIVKIGTNIPQEFRLEQNYPNPFNPSTKIRFNLPTNVKSETSNVKLIIFNGIGQELMTLINNELQPGIYEADWDASDYPSGVYFYTLIAGDYPQTKKMVLVK
jgi:photosystem II stability/assembly factor-like uncharacterized protein